MPSSELVHLNSLSIGYDDSPLFDGLKLSLRRSEITSLVGANGCGKSTILKIIQPNVRPALERAGLRINGTLSVQSNLTIGYLPQDLRSEWINDQPSERPPADQKLIVKLADQFGLDELNHPPEELSDGQRQKLAIIMTVSSDADLYLLDEPTNYLDIRGIMALEQTVGRLQDRGASILIVSHDRAMINQTADQTTYLSPHGIYSTRGGFDDVWSLATGEVTARAKQATAIKRRIDKLQEDIRRRNQWAANKERTKIGAGSAKPSIAKQAAKMAQRSKATEKRSAREIDLLKETKPFVPKKLNLAFPPYEVRHRVAFSFEDVVFAYPSASDQPNSPQLFDQLSLSASTQDKLCLMGPNGTGKTTLIKLITGDLEPNSGTVTRHPSMKFTLLPQGLRGFYAPGSLLDNLASSGDQTTVRQFLGAALIRRQKVEQEVSTLSPGELMRAALVKCILEQAEFLILDEPTSHLDIESIHVLEELLNDFPGGYLMISHDRSFVENTASALYLLEDGALTMA